MSTEETPPGYMFVAGNFDLPDDASAEDLESLKAYGKGAYKAIRAAETRFDYVVRANEVEVLQGEWPFSGGFAIERFSSLEAIMRFWKSDLYKDARKHREGLMDMDVNIAVAGMRKDIAPGVRVADPKGDIKGDVKSAYLVVAGELVDADKTREYMKTGPDLAKAAGQEFVSYTPAKDLNIVEGAWPWPNADLIIERFPSLQAARDFFYDPAYQAALKTREEGYDVKFVVLAEVAEPPA